MPKGFGKLPCPKCGEMTSGIRVYPTDGTIQCQCCDNEFSTDDVKEFIAKWQPVIDWLEAMPERKEES